MLVWILPRVKGVGRTCQEREQRPSSETETLFRLTRTAPAYYPAALLTTSEGTSSVRVQHTRGRRRPLGPEGLATLALRQLNRQPAGVLARTWTTCRLHHH